VESLKVRETIYEEVVRRFEFESDRIKDLDSKASNIVGFVGIITGLASSLGGILLKPYVVTSPIVAYMREIAIGLYFSMLLCFLLSLGFGLRAYQIKKYTVVPNPYYLIGAYENAKTKMEIIRNLYDNYAVAIEDNIIQNDKKVANIKKAMYALFLGIVLLPVFIGFIVFG